MSSNIFNMDKDEFLKDLTGKNYSVTNVLKSNQDQTDLYNNISNSLKKGFAVVVNVKEVPGRYTSTSGHFMVVYQSFIDLAYGIGTVYYTYNDPHYNDDYYGTYPISSYDLLKAISSNSGNYVRVSWVANVLSAKLEKFARYLSSTEVWTTTVKM